MKCIVTAATIILTVLVIGIAIIPKFKEPLTELYFDNHLGLPKDIDLNRDYTFSFVIHNLEDGRMTYFYEITEQYEDTRRLIDVSSITIDDNEVASITKSFRITEDFKRAKIEITLLNKEQKIHFWVNRKQDSFAKAEIFHSLYPRVST